MDSNTSIDEQTRLFAFMGMTLSHVQQVELLINQTLHLVIQEGDFLDKEAWEKQKKFLTRKTLGQMIRILKNRVGIHEHLIVQTADKAPIRCMLPQRAGGHTAAVRCVCNTKHHQRQKCAGSRS